MIYKKGLLYGFVFCLLVFGGSYQYWYPSVQQILKKNINIYIQKKQTEQADMIKTHRHIPIHADLGAYLAGNMALETNNYPAAITYFEKVLESDPENKNVESSLLVLYTIIHQMDKAVPLAYKIADIQMKNLLKTSKFQLIKKSKYRQIDIYLAEHVIIADLLKKGSYQAVIDYYHNQKTSTGSLIAPINIAWCYAGLNQPKEAFKSLDQLKDERFTYVKLYHKALLLSYFGQKTEAMEIYRSLDSESIASVNVFISIAHAFQGTSEWASGQPVYDRQMGYLKKKTTLYDLLRQVGMQPIQTPQQAIADAYYTMAAFLANTDYETSAVLFDSLACYIDEKSNLLKVSLAELYQEIGMYEQANVLYDLIKPSADIIRFKISLNLITMKEYEAALSLLQDLLTRNPSNYIILQLIGTVYQNLNQSEKAIAYLNKSVRLLKQAHQNADAADVLLKVVQINALKGQTDKIIPLLREALALDEQNAEILNYLGYELIDNEINIKEGLQLVQQAKEINSEDPHITDSLAWGYYKSGDYEQALFYGEQIKDEVQGNAIIHAHMGDIYRALGRNLEAESQYRKALTSQIELTPALKKQLQQKLNEPDEVSETESIE